MSRLFVPTCSLDPGVARLALVEFQFRFLQDDSVRRDTGHFHMAEAVEQGAQRIFLLHEHDQAGHQRLVNLRGADEIDGEDPAGFAEFVVPLINLIHHEAELGLHIVAGVG